MATHEHAAHPSAAEYVKVAIFLAIVTAVEVGLYYITGLSEGLLTALLIVFMIVKFAMVGLWFMHLKFDGPLFRRLFIGGLLLATTIYAIVLYGASTSRSFIP